MTPAQCRAARALLDWTIFDLSRASGVMPRTVGAWERGKHPSIGTMVSRMQRALEAAGVEFGDDGHVRLKEATSS